MDEDQRKFTLYLAAIGFVLVFVATPILYICYAATAQGLYSDRRWPLPLVTDMLGDWSITSCAILGLGITFYFTSVALAAVLNRTSNKRHTVVLLCLVVQCSLWIIVPTSVRHGAAPEAISLAHSMSTFTFMASAVWTLHVAAAGKIGAARVAVAISISAMAIGTSSMLCLYFMGRRSNGSQFAWQALAISEITMFLALGVGYYYYSFFHSGVAT